MEKITLAVEYPQYLDKVFLLVPMTTIMKDNIIHFAIILHLKFDVFSHLLYVVILQVSIKLDQQHHLIMISLYYNY